MQPPGNGGPPTAMMPAPPPSGGGPRQENTLAYVSLIAGLLSFGSMLCCCVPFLNWGAPVVMLLCGVTAVITGFIARQKADELQHGKSEATIGLVLGSIWLVAAVVGFVLLLVGVAGLGVIGALSH